MLTRFIAAAGFLVLSAMPGFGDAWDKKTIVTFNEPVIIAGVPQVTLQPGTYVFQLINSVANRNIIRVTNERMDKLYSIVLAIPNYRLDPKEKTEFRYWETPRGNPMALRAWFYPGETFGHEFVYPKGLAAKIARDTGEAVPMIAAETATQLETAPIREVEKTGEEQPLAPAYTAPARAAPEPVVVAQVTPSPAQVTPSPAQTAPAPVQEPIPATASLYYLIGITGLVLVAAAYATRRLAWRAM